MPRSKLLKQLVGTAGTNATGMVLNLLVGVVAARMMTKLEYGTYFFLISTVTLAAIPIVAGLPTLIVREVARAFHSQNIALLYATLIGSRWYIVGYSTVAASICFATTVFWTDRSTAEQFRIALLLLPFLGLIANASAVLRGIGKTPQGQLAELVARPASLLILLGVFFAANRTISVTQALFSTLVSAASAWLLGWYFCRRNLPSVIGETAKFETRAWFVTLLPLTLFAGLRVADIQITNVLVGSLHSMDAVGDYRIASQGAMLVSFGLVACNAVYASRIVQLHQTNRQNELQKTVDTVSKLALLSALPVAVVLLLAGAPLIRFVFGKQYTPAALPLAILVIGQLFNAATGPVALLLNMTGNERSTVLGIVIAIAVKLLLAVCWIPYWGALGASLAAVVSEIVWNLILLLKTYQILKLRSLAFSQYLVAKTEERYL